MPKMGVNPEQTKQEKPVPHDWYELRVKGMVIKKSKSGKGYNYEAYTNVVNNKAEFNDKFISIRINNGYNQAKVANDFTHSLGFELEQDGSFPGDWKLKNDMKQLPDGKIVDKDGKEV